MTASASLTGDGCRVYTEDKTVLHAGCHIGRHIGRMTIVLEPRGKALSTVVVEGLLVSHTNRTNGDTRLAGNTQIVVKECLVEIRKVCPVATIGPVEGYDDDGIGIRTVFADVGHPLLDIAAERLHIGARQTTLFLQNEQWGCHRHPVRRLHPNGY